MISSGRSIRFLLALTAITFATTPAAGQRWSVEAQGGSIRSSLDPANSAQSVALGVRYDDFDTGLGLAVGVPTSSSEPLWGSLNGAKRLAFYRGNLVLGADLSGNAYAMRDRVQRTREVPGGVLRPPTVVEEPGLSGAAFAAQALPLIGYEGTRIQLHARAGVSHYLSNFGETDHERTVVLSDVQLTYMPTPSFAIIPAVQRFHTGGMQYTYAGVSAFMANNLGSLWGGAGHWIDLDSAGTAWAAGATLQLHRRAAITLSGRHDAFDALYANPAQTSWSLGVRVQIGGPPAFAPPVPAQYVDGRATIELESDATSSPQIAGDFTNWKPQPMRRVGDKWTFSTKLAPGVYNYAFVDRDGDWFVPKGHPGRKDDGMGGEVAVLVVRE